MGLRRDLNSPGALGQLAVIGCMTMIIGLVCVAGSVGSDWATRSHGGALVPLGLTLTLTLISVRRLPRR